MNRLPKSISALKGEYLIFSQVRDEAKAEIFMCDKHLDKIKKRLIKMGYGREVR